MLLFHTTAFLGDPYCCTRDNVDTPRLLLRLMSCGGMWVRGVARDKTLIAWIVDTDIVG